MPQKISSSVQELHNRFRMYGKNAGEWMRKCMLMLPELERERVWEKKGFGSLSEYAGRMSGMGAEMVYEGLRVLRVAENMPDVMKVIRDRGISIVRPVLTLLTVENQQFWAAKMRVMSKQTLTLYRQEWEREHMSVGTDGVPKMIDSTLGDKIQAPALDIIFRPGSEKSINSPQGTPLQWCPLREAIKIQDFHTSTPVIEPFPPNKIIGIELSPSTIDRLTKLKGNDEWDTLMNELMDMREAVLEQNKPEEKATDSRHIPMAIQRFVRERSRGVCEVGICTKKYTILHHIQRFASGKVHDPDRIVALCKQHERLVHLGLIHDETIAPKQWKMLQEPDKNDPKYQIDQLVQKYRRPGEARFGRVDS